MTYRKIDLFGKQKSRGSFDDIYNSKLYSSIEEAYAAKDYVECNFVESIDEELFIEAVHIQAPEIKRYYRLNFQRPIFGLDVMDDVLAVDMAKDLLHT